MSQLENCPAISVWSDIRSGTQWGILYCDTQLSPPHPSYPHHIMLVGSWLLSWKWSCQWFIYQPLSVYSSLGSSRSPQQVLGRLWRLIMSYPCLLFFIKEQNKNLIKYTIVNHLGKNIWVGIRRLYRDKKICLSSQKQWGAIAQPTTYM